MNWIYLDTSVAVHALRGTPAAETWFDAVTGTAAGSLVSSRILRTALTRVLYRDGLPVAERDVILRHVAITPLTDAVLTHAEAITHRVKTLDAIHLASALAMGSRTVVATHDTPMKAAVDAIGLSWIDPVDDRSLVD